MRRPVAGLVGGQRHPRAQVRTLQQGIDHAGSRSRIRQPLIPSRRHLRQRERRAAEHPRQSSHLLDVRRGVAAHPGRVAAVLGVNLVSANVLAIGTGDPQVPRDRLEPMTR